MASITTHTSDIAHGTDVRAWMDSNYAGLLARFNARVADVAKWQRHTDTLLFVGGETIDKGTGLMLYALPHIMAALIRDFAPRGIIPVARTVHEDDGSSATLVTLFVPERTQ